MAVRSVVFLLVFQWVAIQTSHTKEMNIKHRDMDDLLNELVVTAHRHSRLFLPLNSTNVLQKSQRIRGKTDCVFACLSEPWCHSMNLKITPDKDGRHVCEVLSTDKYNNSKHFIPDKGFTHLSIKSPCESIPCDDDGACIALYDKNDYYCTTCAAGFTGRRCSVIDVRMSYSNNFCGGISLSAHSGAIKSPNYPGSYGNARRCEVVITSNTRIGLFFTAFTTEKNYDYVKVYDGNSSSSPRLLEISGSVIPYLNTSSSGNKLCIIFTSDASGDSGLGFHANFSAIIRGSLRLMGGTISKGRVEVFYDGKWGTICDDQWDMNDAAVVCRQLGFSRAKYALRGAHSGQGSGVIMLDKLNCLGTETNIRECSHGRWKVNSCSHSQDAAVECQY